MSYFSQSILIKAFVFFNDKLIVNVLSAWLIHCLKLLSSTHQVITDTNVIVSFQLSFISSEVKSSSKTSIHWCLINNNSVFNIIPTVRHDCDTGVMTGRKLIIIDQLNMCSFCHWLLWIYQHIIYSVWSNHFIQSNNSLCLLTHRALEQVSWWLIVMRIRNDTWYHTQNCKGINLHVSMMSCNLIWS